jgi:hypothetical protein
MTIELSPRSSLLEELASFFEIAGFSVSGEMIDGKEYLYVHDIRGDDWKMDITLTLSDDGKQLVVPRYSAKCKLLRFAQEEEFTLIVSDEETEDDIMSFTYYSKEPLKIDFNEHFIKMIVEHPVHTLLYEALKGRTGIDSDFANELINKVWDYGENTDQRMELVIMYFEKKFFPKS